MNNFTKIFLITMLLPVVSSIAIAEDEPHQFSANFSMASDYVYRGQSQTGNEPSVSGGLDYTNTDLGLYLGTWASNVNFGGDMEIDWYGGFAGSFSDNGISWDVGVLYYQYPGSPDGSDLDFIEGHLGLGYTFTDIIGEPSIGFAMHYSPDWQGSTGDSVFYDGNISFNLPYDFSFSSHLGYQTVEENANWGTPDWFEYSVGLSRSISIFDFSLNYVDSDLSRNQCYGGSNVCDGRVLFSVSSSF